jgi:hypothetical protein
LIARLGNDADGVRANARDDLRPEIEALLALVAADETRAPALVARSRPDVLVDLARLNKTLGSLAPAREALRRRAPAAAARLDLYGLRTLALNGSCLHAGARVSAALRKAGIRHVVIKGPLQQQSLYGSPTVRPSGDVDVLIDGPDRVRACRVLEALGYRRAEARLSAWWVRHLGEEHFVRGAGEPTVDLHHGLSQPGSPRVAAHHAFLDAVRPTSVEGVLVPTPSAAHLTLLAALGLVKALVAREPCLGHAADLLRAHAMLDAGERDALAGQARLHGQAETLAAAQAASARVLAARPSPAADDPLAAIDDETLRGMVVAPWSVARTAPRRRALLWVLCGRAPARFAREAARVLAADLSRLRLEAAR